MIDNISGTEIGEDYEGQWIVGGVGGKHEGKIYLLIQTEVSYSNGGSRYTLKHLQTLTQLVT